jgi:hypothetical protein
MKDRPVLFYCKDGVLYPVMLTNEEQQLLEGSVRMLFAPLKLIDKPQGKAVNLFGK